APRGLSAEEKRIRLLEIFHETKDFFQLKELEKLGPKNKGIVSQTVKEVLLSLVDDGLVHTDKIGSSNFFWSFPSQQGAIVQTKLMTCSEARQGYKNQVSELQAALAREVSTRTDSEQRKNALSMLADLEEQLRELEKELTAYGTCDPARFAETKRSVFLAKEASLRWTDNYSTLLGYFTRQNGANAADVRKYLGIEDDYEDIC
ncbi:hypothetical protein M378DRAFT_75652, partial [Amanita muscaria Koide BX008]